MLVSMVELMKKAREGKYCIPAPAVENEHSVRACLEAAEATRSPVIMISLYKVNPDIVTFGHIVQQMAAKSSVPVAMCQDHGGTYEEAMWAIRAGFSDVMVDRSMLPYEENVQLVKEIVKIAHAVGVGVEAELGHVGYADNYEHDGKHGLTVPDEAVRYVEETGIDALAVAIGTAHGTYKGTPELHFELLHELRQKVQIPLVIHGASGTGDDNLRKICAEGICKLNISNDLKKGAISALTSQEDLMGMGAYRMYAKLSEGYRDTLLRYIDICGSANKA